MRQDIEEPAQDFKSPRAGFYNYWLFLQIAECTGVQIGHKFIRCHIGTLKKEKSSASLGSRFLSYKNAGESAAQAAQYFIGNGAVCFCQIIGGYPMLTKFSDDYGNTVV